MYSFEALALQIQVKFNISRERGEILTQKVATLLEELTPTLRKAIDLATGLNLTPFWCYRTHLIFTVHGDHRWQYNTLSISAAKYL